MTILALSEKPLRIQPHCKHLEKEADSGVQRKMLCFGQTPAMRCCRKTVEQFEAWFFEIRRDSEINEGGKVWNIVNAAENLSVLISFQ